MATWRSLAAILFTAFFLVACGGGSSDGDVSGSDTPTNPGDGGDDGGVDTAGRTFMIEPGSESTSDAQTAFIKARPKDTIEFGCGFFALDSTLLLTQTENVTITGCGMDETVLSFAESDGAVGILVDSARGITIEKLTVADTPGNGVELRNVDHATLDKVRAFWSSNGGSQSPDRIKASNYQDGRLDVACTDPATKDPGAPENQLPGADTTSPDYTVSDKAGRYGIYPVKSRNILVENAESIGASDAGIYVGQTTTAIIRDSRAAYNVFGFEIENVRHGEYANNLSECNTGGFLIYDLDNLTRYGQRTLMHDNVSRMNNTYNFTEGGFVSNVPSGSGMITLAYDRIDVFDNEFIDNNTGGIIHTSYQIFPEGDRPTDNKIDFYTEGVRIFRNKFRNNGNNLPEPTTSNLQSQNVAKLLPALLGLKTATGCALNPGKCPLPLDSSLGVRGAHIIWDGLLPEYNENCPYPEDAEGNPVPEEERFEGKPRHTNEHPNPDCHYNKYKFETDAQGQVRRDGDGTAIRKKPLYFSSCIASNNDFGPNSVKYSNFHGTKGLEAALTLLGSDPLSSLLTPTTLQNIVDSAPQFPAEFDLTPHRCQQAYGETLPKIESVEIPPFEPSGNFAPAPSEEEIARLCEADVAATEVNWGATKVNCPRLAQYNLFRDADDPTSQPNGGGFPFVLNTKLFSDYSVKYRVMFLPPGETATYQAPGAGKPAATIQFPVGTVIAKTFSFVDEQQAPAEKPIETRLLIKRERNNGDSIWKGLPYVWQTQDGEKIAKLDLDGKDEIAASWDYQNVNTGEQLTGSTDGYSVPNANQCLSCHANRDRPAGSAPIGPKVRNINRAYESESPVVTDQGRHPIAGQNQIAWMCNNGKMNNCPNLDLGTNGRIATNLNRIPKYNVSGDSGEPKGSDADIEDRTRAFLEANCQHCHNPDGFASNTGYYLDVFRRVDTSYGICKGPTATGAEGSGGRAVDVKPQSADGSILAYRIGPEADTPGAMMPPISRSVVHEEGHELIQNWINNVVVADNSQYPGSESCVDN